MYQQTTLAKRKTQNVKHKTQKVKGKRQKVKENLPSYCQTFQVKFEKLWTEQID